MKVKDLLRERTIRKVLLFLLLSVAGMTNVYAVTIGDLTYSLYSSTLTATVTGHKDGTSATGSLTIPSSVTYTSGEWVNGEYVSVTRTYSVTTIGVSAFYGCSGFTGSLTIPNSVTTIGEYAFYGCSGFTGSLTIPNSVTTIGECAFYGCSGFTGSLTIPNSVTTIGGVAFFDCSGFTGSLTIPNSVTTIGEGAFSGCSGFTGSLTIPNSVTTIGEYAFYGCSGFTGSLTIPNSVTTIGECAFYGCSGFTGSLTIPNSVTTIGGVAFFDCSGFTGSLTIPNSVTTIGEGAFSGCSGFTGSLTIPNSVTTIGEYAFYGCSGFTGDLTIPNSVTTIGEYAFYGCSGFTGSLTIPNSVTTIGYSAFRNCSGLSEVYWNAANCGNANSGYPPFRNCGGSLVIGSNVERIPNWMFQDAAFTAFTIPNSVTEIGKGAFSGCSNLVGTLVLPENLVSIGDEAFRYCGGFQGELSLPETLTSVGSYAFAGCNEISAINYNAINCETMGSPGQNVFYDCISVRHIRIGENVESIPNHAFKGCFMTQDIASAAEVPPTIASNTFGTVSREIPVSVPYGSGADYRSAQYWEEFFNITEDYTPTQYPYHWNVDAYQFADNMTVTGIIQIDGMEQTTEALEIGVFCGDECRGRQQLHYYPQVDRYLVFLVIYGEDGDPLTFRLYDHELGEESQMGCESQITFEANATVGSPDNPHVFNFANMQTTTFAAGWNWWSSYVELGDSGLSQLQEGFGTNGLTIKSQNDGYSSYLEGMGWYGSLAAIDNESTYQVRTANACAMSLTGSMANPSDHPITLNPGWTWVGYPVNTPMSVIDALAGITPQTGDMIKSQTDGYAYYLEGIGWFGSLNTIQPGMGLMFKSNSASAVTLVYPNGRTRTDLKANQTAENNHWQSNLNAYPDNMSVMAVVELDGIELQGENYELATFANGECRGSARLLYVEPLNRYMAFLTIAGEEAAELHFGLYNIETGMVETQCLASLQYETNAVVGSFAEPYVVSFRSMTSTDEGVNNLQIYPNPVGRGQTVSLDFDDAETGKVCVEIINALGMVVETYHGASPQTIVAPKVAGVYMLRITMEGRGTSYRKLVVKE